MHTNTTEAHQETDSKPNESSYDELHRKTIADEKCFIENSKYRAYSLNVTHNPYMLTHIIFENMNKITNNYREKDDNDIE